MTKKQYAAKRLDPQWQKRRLEIFERDGWACRECGDTESTLSVHHTYYVGGRDPWQYPDWSLITVCPSCHDKVGDKFASRTHHFENIIAMLANGTPDRMDEIWRTLQRIHAAKKLRSFRKDMVEYGHRAKMFCRVGLYKLIRPGTWTGWSI